MIISLIQINQVVKITPSLGFNDMYIKARINWDLNQTEITIILRTKK